VYNLQTENLITNVMIQEQFTPLVGLNFAWKNGITTTVDFKRSRSLALNIGAMQLAEARNTELSINLSYRKDGLLPSFSLFGKERQLKNTITFRFETTVRSIRMANRKLDSLGPHAEAVMSFIMLSVIDDKWKDHLFDLDALKASISFRGWGQKDPLVEYKKEAYDQFVDLMKDIRKTLASLYFRAQVGAPQPQQQPASQPPRLPASHQLSAEVTSLAAPALEKTSAFRVW
jgi:preprotein translocase subunit SecA